MKMLQQILSEAGADTAKSYTIIPEFGGYFKSVKQVIEYSSEKVVLQIGKTRLIVTGKNLAIGKYFEGDLLISGNVEGTLIE